MTVPFPPRATARLQFRDGFTLADGCAVVGYLRDLGVSHVYASPLLRARQGSTHGYDVVDFTEIDPALGGEDAFRRFSATLAAHGMGLIVDFVPNHMGVGTENAWWMDVLTWGRDSVHAPVFDIDWASAACPGKVLLPILDRPYAEALASGIIGLAFDAERGRFTVRCPGRELPLNPATQGMLLRRAAAMVAVPAVGRRLNALATACEAIRPGIRVGVERQAEAFSRDLAVLAGSEPEARAAIERMTEAVGGAGVEAEAARPRRSLHDLLEAQHYRLAHWRLAASEINYRRFFDIDDLIGIRVEDPTVFDAVHRWLLDAAAADRIQGVRLDHIDGLADPAGYLRRLRRAIDTVSTFPFAIHVEKILAAGEPLPPDWPIEGTTGYETMAAIHDVLVDRSGRPAFEAAFRAFTGRAESFEDVVRTARRQTLARTFPGAFSALSDLLLTIARADSTTRDAPRQLLRDALEAVIVTFPTYRSYVRPDAPSGTPPALAAALADAATRLPPDAAPVLALLRRVLSGECGPAPAAIATAARTLAIRFQQLTSPIAAKSVEDTAYYRHVPLVSLNEVGGAPERYGLDTPSFHAFQRDHAASWPAALVPLATHDHKRGADVRARLAALSERGAEWDARIASWSRATGRFVRRNEKCRMPSPTHEYLFYQTLLGLWPASGEPGPDLADRVAAYMVKAAREGKEKTAWIDGDAAYEAALESFVRGALDPVRGKDFRQDFAWFARSVARAGAVKGLAQVVLQMTIPGVPDLYQGSEDWDLTLVDPDNRRPVDYAGLAARLQAVAGAAVDPLLETWPDGRVKQWLVHRLLGLRRGDPLLFARGRYAAVEADGPDAEDLLAWRREHEGRHLVALVPRRIGGRLPPEGGLGLSGFADGRLPLPVAGHWTEVITGEQVEAPDALLVDLSHRLARFPAIVLSRTEA